MKAYTDIEQSKKLAEILPIESADMRYGYTAPYEFSDRKYDGGYDEIPYQKDFLIKNPNYSTDEYDAELPCWSLAALLGVMPHIQEFYPTIEKINDKFVCRYKGSGIWTNGTNPVDACYEMIVKLKEKNLL